MAKISVWTALLILSVFPGAHAQNPTDYYEEIPRTFYGGLIAGSNFTQVDGDNYAGYRHIGINVGGIVYTRFDEHLAASLEILYSQKGAKSNGPTEVFGGYVIQDYKVILNYAEVPIQLNYFDKRKSHFGAGFSVSRLISATETGTATGGPPLPVNFDEYPFRKMDFNFIVGGNLHLYSGFFLNIRFQYSLASIRKDPPPVFKGRDQQFNNMWALRLMYLF